MHYEVKQAAPFFNEIAGLEGIPLQRLICSAKDVREGDLLVIRDGPGRAGTIASAVRRWQISEAIPLLVSRNIEGLSNQLIRVKSTQDVVDAYINCKRKSFDTQWIYVTGSVGKTTTSYLLHRALSLFNSSYYARKGNIYSAICASACLLDEEKFHFAVFEVAQGGLPAAAENFNPDVSLLLSLSPAHMERYKTFKELVHRKSEVFKGGGAGSIAVINHDIQYFDLVEKTAKDYGRQCVTFGLHPEADFKINRYVHGRVEFINRGESYLAKHSALGEHISNNLVAVIATLDSLSLPWQSNLEKIAQQAFVPRGRGNIVEYKTNNNVVTYIDQSYNSTPGSMDAALKMLCDYPATGKKIIVLSDMLELGEKAAKYHSDLFKSMNEMDLDLVVTCGELTNRKVMKEYKHKYECFDSVEESFTYIDSLIQNGDVVMVKGSNSTGLNAALCKRLYKK